MCYLVGLAMLAPKMSFDVQRVRRDFPALRQKVHGHRLAYLDSASTTQKPLVVLEALRSAYETQCANIHRGVHSLSVAATASFEAVRQQTADFLGAVHREEVIFTRSTTEALNLVAQSYGRSVLRAGDEVLVSEMEHHSNIVPWQMLCGEVGAKLKVLPVDDRGMLQVELLDALLSDRTKIVAVAHVSNAMGTVNPIKEICAKAHAAGAVVVVDGAQAVPHMPASVAELGCDFYAFSGHKLYAPTGVGVLWARRALLEGMPPWQGGGDMIASVSFKQTKYADIPHRFEAGTPNIFGVMAMGVAMDYLTVIGRPAIAHYESQLLNYATTLLSDIPGLRVIGQASNRVGVLSFVVEGMHPHDVGTLLDLEGIAVRTGHHCAEPLMTRFGVSGTVRASFGLYNTVEEVERLALGVCKAQKVLNP